MENKRVLIGMSGGIDSSISAILLKEQGYELVGLTLRTWDYITDSCMSKKTGCCSVEALYEAKDFCKKLGFEHYTLDVREQFNNHVIKNFVDEYLNARTPNPCVVCNPFFKWDAVINKANELNCAYIATGHYSQIIKKDERYILQKGLDSNKDQSYFLWGLSQKHLSRTLFPLGDFTKDEVREIAKNHGFNLLAQKKESQEICFVQKGDYRDFLKERLPDLEQKLKGGNFVDSSGKILGQHKGYPFYTIGQRKGLEIAVGYPLYVQKIDSKTNTVVLGPREELYKKEMFVRNFNLIKYENIDNELEVYTKIRYRSESVLSRIKKENGLVKVEFYENVSSITPGQSAVFYQDKDVVGGGFIV